MAFKLGAAALALALSLPFAGAATIAPSVAAAQAARDAQAEAFVQTEANRALGILNDKGMSATAKKAAFRSFVDQVADIPRVTGFVLGKYNRSITPEQRAAFAPVFRDYASSVYESRLGDYKGESLKVVGSTVRKPGDVIVSSQVVGGAQKQPVRVSWRVVKGDDGRWKVVDVEVAGVWLAITQQQDFVSTIDNAKGDVNVLINQLKRQVASGTVPGKS